MTARQLTESVLDKLEVACMLTAALDVSEKNTQYVQQIWEGLVDERFTITYPGQSGPVTKEGQFLGPVVIDGNRYGLKFRVPKGQRTDKFRTPMVPASDIEELTHLPNTDRGGPAAPWTSVHSES